MEEGDGLRARSFRNEDYNNRRAFLTSYPLQFDNDEHNQETHVPTTATTNGNRASKGLADTGKFAHGDEEKKKLKMKKKKEEMKKMMVTIVEWGGGRLVVLRRFKHKISFYVVSCFPIVFKPPKALISSS